MVEDNEKSTAELLTMLDMIRTDIERCKQWHWRFLYNAVIVYGIILWMSAKYSSLLLDCFLILLACATAIAGLHLIKRTQKDLEGCREKARFCIQDLPPYLTRLEDPNRLNTLSFSSYAKTAVIVGAILVIALIVGSALFS